VIVHLMRSRYMIQSDPSAANLGLCNVKSLAIMVASGVVLGMQICFLTVLTRYVLILLCAGTHNPVNRDDASESRGQRGIGCRGKVRLRKRE